MTTEPRNSMMQGLEALEAQLCEAYEQVPFGSYSVDDHGQFTAINTVALSWLGQERADLIGKRKPMEFLTHSSQELLARRLAQRGADGMAGLELEMLDCHGGIKHVCLHGVATSLAMGADQAHRALVFDNSDRHEQQVSQRIAALAFDSPLGIGVMDANHAIVQANQGFSLLTGFSMEELRGKGLRFLNSGRQSSEFFTAMWQGLEHKGHWQGEVHLRRKDNSSFIGWLDLSSISGPHSKGGQTVARLHDITAHKASQREIDQLAFFDPLTQLPNRRLLLERLERMVASTHIKDEFGALLFIDIDNFKTINDTRGHAAGDQLLVEVAHRLRETVRPGDTVARLGGDEFVSLLTLVGADRKAASTHALKVGRKILSALEDVYRFDGFTFSTSASIGVSLIDGAQTVSEVLLQADLAMYEAKRAGRNAVRLFHPDMKAAADEHSAIKQEIWQALKQGQFELYYQPQFDEAWRVVAAEALLRWHHPTKGVLAPGHFIEAAEQTGLIVPIGRWVIETGCRQLAAWAAHAATRDMVLAINVSALQFGEADFLDHLQQTVTKCGTDPHRLMLELTETTVHSVDDIRTKMLPLRDMGVRFALDDFGIGHSSLARLIGLPIDQLKIDRSFVHDMAKTGAANVVVNTIVGMADSLGVEVIAEGVETAHQLNALLAAGCPMFQGYLMSRPVQVSAFEALLPGHKPS